MVITDKKALNRFRKFAKKSYPLECCGFLIGTEADKTLIVSYIYIPQNQAEYASEDQILITEEWFEAALDFAREQDMYMIGFIHSHPDYSDTSLSEQDISITADLRRAMKPIKNPVMGIVGVYKRSNGLHTKVTMWPMFSKRELEIK